MNSIPLNVFLSPVLIAVAVGLMVGAARHKSASGNARGLLIAGGLALLVVGLLNTAMSLGGAGTAPWVAAMVLGSAFVGAFAGYWVGHISHGPSPS